MFVSRKLGENGIRRTAGDAHYEELKKRIGRRSGIAVAVAGLAPPPFPFTAVIAPVSDIGYPIWKTVVADFLSSSARFAILSFLALRFGGQIPEIAKSPVFVWTMVAFILICLVASGFYIVHWLRKPGGRSAAAPA